MNPRVVSLGNASASLWLADARQFLKTLAPESVDLIVTSPPYFVGKEYDTSKSSADFVREIRRVLPAMTAALRPGGSLCWQVGNHVENGTLTPLDFLVGSAMGRRTEFALKNRIIWTFNHGAHDSRRFSGRHETILWYQKAGSPYFDLDAVRVPQLYPGKRHYKGPKKGEWSGNPLGKNPGDVWEQGAVWDIPNVKAQHVEKTIHPCQFPTALVRRLIVALSPQGGLVVDPYLGSGSTSVAALLEGRNFAGSDLEQRYLDVAAQRVKGLADGSSRVRDDLPTRQPVTGESVAQVPPHFRSYLKAANG
jgi:adenine-specific DNA-methyltransferase